MNEGSARHDVCADPLDDYWRKKVDRATKEINRLMNNDTQARPPPAHVRRTWAGKSRIMAGRELKFRDLWNAGAPKWWLIQAGFGSAPYETAQRLRYQGLWLDIRLPGWVPPADWRQRVDALIDQD